MYILALYVHMFMYMYIINIVQYSGCVGVGTEIIIILLVNCLETIWLAGHMYTQADVYTSKAGFLVVC